MEHNIKVGDKTFNVIDNTFQENINIESLVSIDTNNLFGEAMSITQLKNQIGLLKSQLENDINNLKLDIKIFESTFVMNIRKTASKNSNKYQFEEDGEVYEIKVTEKYLDTCFYTNQDWKDLNRDLIEKQKSLSDLDVLYWSANNKSNKLDNMLQGTNQE
tara:strand:- start:13 stop:492 length:480 start_codon:yes stop_codon:yes gene_type:complete